MIPSTFSLPRFARLLPAAVLGVAMVLGGCDSTSPADEADDTPTVEAAALSDAVTSLSTAASLSDDQANALRERLATYDGERTPGLLWAVAADAHQQLTDDQMAALRARIQERRADRRENGPRRGPRGPFRKALRHRLQALDLTDVQREELRAFRAEYRDEMQSFREACREGTLSEADAEAWRALRTEMREAFRDVLTDEQRQQLDARRDELEDRREQIRDARAEALDLTDEQRARFDSLRAEFGGSGDRLLRRCNRENRGERPGASILTEEQKEIVMIHRVLRHGVMTGHKERRGPRS
jgi:Spy/CpxP family protein refolding chaperone